jgi:arylsulfatase
MLADAPAIPATSHTLTPSIGGQSLSDLGGSYMNDFHAREFWRFVSVQDEVKKLALTAILLIGLADPWQVDS